MEGIQGKALFSSTKLRARSPENVVGLGPTRSCFASPSSGYDRGPAGTIICRTCPTDMPRMPSSRPLTTLRREKRARIRMGEVIYVDPVRTLDFLSRSTSHPQARSGCSLGLCQTRRPEARPTPERAFQSSRWCSHSKRRQPCRPAGPAAHEV